MSTDDNKAEVPWLERALPWIASLSIMGLMIPGEFILARQAGWPLLLAPLYPVALAAYGISAQLWESKLDMGISFVVKIAVQICAHLAAVGLIDLNPAFVITIACAPVVMGERVIAMAIKRQRSRRERGQPAAAAAEPVPVPAPAAPSPAPARPHPPMPVSASAVPHRREPVWREHAPGDCQAHPDTHAKIAVAAQHNPRATQKRVASIAGVDLRTAQRCLSGRRHPQPTNV